MGNVSQCRPARKNRDGGACHREKRLDEAMALGRREAHVPFDIGQLPLIRVTLLRMSADHGILLVTAHQIVFDGLSIRNLAHEFGTIAAALDAKRPHDLPEPPLQYGDYCLWQKEYFASAGFEAETTYWKNKLSGAPYFEIFPDHERPTQPTYRGRHFMPLAAFLVQTHPPALALRVVVLDAHGDDGADAGKGERHYGNQRPVTQADQR